MRLDGWQIAMVMVTMIMTMMMIVIEDDDDDDDSDDDNKIDFDECVGCFFFSAYQKVVSLSYINKPG